jgi:alanine racemase
MVVNSRVSTRPTWAEVALANLAHNFRVVQAHVGTSLVCAVVKADAYGHGAVACSRALEEAGARWFGVTTTDEALPLRQAGIRGRILLMTGFWRGEEEEVVRQNLTATVWEPWHLALLERAAARLSLRSVPVHLKIDTGMGRLGTSLEQLPALLALLKSTPHLELEGLCTHFASSEIADAPEMEAQTEKFATAEKLVHEAGLTPSIFHLANTAAVVSRPASWRSMVRPGLALYGYSLPIQRGGDLQPETPAALDLRPVLSWKTLVLSVHDAPAGQALGYGGAFVTKTPSRIAVLPLGYADGLVRKLSNRGRVIVRDHYAPIVGRISMDLTLVDVTGIPDVALGDEVILLGKSESCSVDAWEQARLADTLPYEILCGISKRVPRKNVAEERLPKLEVGLQK